ncbi:unnamed protein product [Rotaria sordida]|uniref:Uncharacterized protein n=1 Tax=Rotaria sordida TaxID=392033 RepID=A0A814WNU5_9BILA|nr:unnamed protein product [Rotaria sordida]CAF1479492.1 unnamed protein product [Rotaria sordida]
MQPVTMLVFVLLTFRNVRQSRQRVSGTTGTQPNRSRKQFISMIFTQVIATGFIALPWAITLTGLINIIVKLISNGKINVETSDSSPNIMCTSKKLK